MRSSFFRVLIFILSVLFLMRGASIAQYEQAAAANPPIAQPLVREGDLAVRLVEALGLGTPAGEAEAESILISAGITPRNGWIADYPVTPDIEGEMQASISEAADSGTLSVGKDAALTAFHDVVKGYGLSVRAAESQSGTPGVNQPESTVINDYYNTEGPPVVTYYAPPPNYAYMYTWVPYPFWGWDFWFPGFFILGDFDVRAPRHEHERRQGEFISNHFRDPRTDKMLRVNPTNRSRGGTFGETGGTRGFGAPRPFGGTRSSAFDRLGNSRFEGAAGDRGFRSRSSAGHIPVPAGHIPAGHIPSSNIPAGHIPGGVFTNRDKNGKGETGKGDTGEGGFRDSRGGTFHGGGRQR